MKCVVCRQGETGRGRTTVVLQRDGVTLVMKEVPAEVCANCGEAYVAEETTERLLQTAEELARSGAEVDVRQFAA